MRLDMVKKIKNVSPHQDPVKELLRQKAVRRALSQRWDRYSLMVVYLVLAVVIILRVEGFSLYLVGGVAAGGLLMLWLIAYLQGKRLEKDLFRAEAEYYLEQFSDELLSDSRRDKLLTGPTPLSTRELEVLCYIVQGQTNKQIAVSMNISQQTIKNHITHILKKMEVSDRTSAAVTALKLGWIRTTADGNFEITRTDPRNN
jgi:DNA-binding CsgD family transcriptional regulator